MGKPTVGVAGGQAALTTSGYGETCSYTKPATFFSGYVHNKNAATIYIHIYDAVAYPGDGNVPTLPPIVVPSDGNASLDFWGGHHFGTGITIAASTTAATGTELGASDVFIFATVR